MMILRLQLHLQQVILAASQDECHMAHSCGETPTVFGNTLHSACKIINSSEGRSKFKPNATKQLVLPSYTSGMRFGSMAHQQCAACTVCKPRKTWHIPPSLIGADFHFNHQSSIYRMNIASMVYIRTSIYSFPRRKSNIKHQSLKQSKFMVNFPIYIHLPIYPNVDK